MDLSAELGRSLLELAPDPTVVVDAGGTIVFANAQVTSAFGYSASELIGLPVEILMPQRFRTGHPGHRLDFAAQPYARPMGAGLALRGLHKDGREFPLEISLSPVKTSSGMLVVAAIRDATAHRDVENQLVEENRAKSRFLAAASHDLRQPLQTLNLLNRVARRQAADDSALHETLERQQRALDSMSALLASVLDISKLDSGAVIPTPRVCAIDEIFERIRSDFEPQAADKDLELVVPVTGKGTYADPELLRRLLGNLVSNAIRYTDSGEVRLSCERQGEELRIAVSDTGLGIPEADRNRIFEEFYQVDRGSQRPEGLGLGLSIVRRIATLLGCRIDLSSQPGVGTTFTVTLPARDLPTARTSPQGGMGVNMEAKILIVDDEVAVAEATSLLLQIEGFDVRVASCQQEALEHIEDYAPDLIVSDYHLRGGETGVGVVTAVRDRVGASIPVVFVTGDTARSALERSSLDCADLLNKPIRADDLLKLIRTRLGVNAPNSTPAPQFN